MPCTELCHTVLPDVDGDTFLTELEAETHQLNKIFDIIGTPSESDLARIENSQLRKCVAQLECKGAIPLSQRCPSANEPELSLLKRMLCFSPQYVHCASIRSTLPCRLIFISVTQSIMSSLG